MGQQRTREEEIRRKGKTRRVLLLYEVDEGRDGFRAVGELFDVSSLHMHDIQYGRFLAILVYMIFTSGY